MPKKRNKIEATSSATVVFAYYEKDKLEEREVKFVVPENYLWSENGMRRLYCDTRVAFLGNPDNDTEAWESWHLASASLAEVNFVLTGAFRTC